MRATEITENTENTGKQHRSKAGAIDLQAVRAKLQQGGPLRQGSGHAPVWRGLDELAGTAEFQDYLTSMAWGVWTRGGALTTRDRSLLVLAMTAALGRMEEFHLHASSAPRAGVSDAEVDELLFQIAAYCGAPAGVAARRTVKAVRAARRSE